MAARVELREISNEEGNRLLRMVRRGSGSVVTWRRAQIVLLAAQRMPAARIAEVVFTDPDTVREVIHNFNRDGFEALYPRYRGGRPRTFTLPRSGRRSSGSRWRSRPTSASRLRPGAWPSWPTTWSPRGWSTDISHEGLRQLLREEGVSFQAVRTWKRSNDPDFEAKKNRILELYAIADGLAEAGPGDPDVGHLPGRVRAAEPAAPARREGLGAKRQAETDPRHLHPPARRPPPARRLRRRRRPALRPRQEAQDRGSSSSPSAATSARATRPRSGSPSSSTTSPRTKATRSATGPTPTTSSSPTPPLRLLAQPDRAAVQRPPLLLPRRHRPL